MGCPALLQGLLPTQGSNAGLLHCRWILYYLSHQGSQNLLLLTLIAASIYLYVFIQVNIYMYIYIYIFVEVFDE